MKISLSLINAALFLVSSITTIIVVELMMEARIIWMKPLTKEGQIDVAALSRHAAAERGVTYDTASVFEVIAKKRATGERAFPTISPGYYLDEKAQSKIIMGGQPVIPLGIASRSSTYYCNESGQYVEFKTDQFGFRNPDQLWLLNNLQVMVVGDSYALGSCLSVTDSIVGQIRKSLPKTLNLGMGGNGPLVELAGIREYVSKKKPQIVLWMFFENDLDDLEREKSNRILLNYLQPNFSQHLFENKDEINRYVDKVSENYYGLIGAAEKARKSESQERWYYFPRIRSLIKFFNNNLKSKHNEPDIQLFRQILEAANKDILRYGGRLYFVYIPDCASKAYGNKWRDNLLKQVRSIGIPVIDTMPAIYTTHHTERLSYFYCPASHFNELGAKITAKEIIHVLESR